VVHGHTPATRQVTDLKVLEKAAYLYGASPLNKHGSPEIVGELFGWPRYRPPNPKQRFAFAFNLIRKCQGTSYGTVAKFFL
jgi:hypothetical protein